jgi:hypothetical protein
VDFAALVGAMRLGCDEEVFAGLAKNPNVTDAQLRKETSALLDSPLFVQHPGGRSDIIGRVLAERPSLKLEELTAKELFGPLDDDDSRVSILESIVARRPTLDTGLAALHHLEESRLKLTKDVAMPVVVQAVKAGVPISTALALDWRDDTAKLELIHELAWTLKGQSVDDVIPTLRSLQKLPGAHGLWTFTLGRLAAGSASAGQMKALLAGTGSPAAADTLFAMYKRNLLDPEGAASFPAEECLSVHRAIAELGTSDDVVASMRALMEMPSVVSKTQLLEAVRLVTDPKTASELLNEIARRPDTLEEQ